MHDEGRYYEVVWVKDSMEEYKFISYNKVQSSIPKEFFCLGKHLILSKFKLDHYGYLLVYVENLFLIYVNFYN